MAKDGQKQGETDAQNNKKMAPQGGMSAKQYENYKQGYNNQTKKGGK